MSGTQGHHQLGARQRFAEQYRRDRATARLIQSFRAKTGDYIRSDALWDGLSRGFDFCRLHGDLLSDRRTQVRVAWAGIKLDHFRQPVRLPA